MTVKIGACRALGCLYPLSLSLNRNSGSISLLLSCGLYVCDCSLSFDCQPIYNLEVFRLRAVELNLQVLKVSLGSLFFIFVSTLLRIYG